MGDHASWPELIFYAIFFLAIFGGFGKIAEIVKLFINRRYDAKVAAVQAKAGASQPQSTSATDLSKEN